MARIALAVLAFLLAASAAAPMNPPIAPERSAAAQGGEGDIALYEAVTERVRHGENYYDFIVPEQRAHNYPVNPALAVRLPTLAYTAAWLGDFGQVAAAIVLMLGVIAAWRRKFREDPALGRWTGMATAMVCVGASLGVNRSFFPLHELWAGMLLALSFGLHRIGTNGHGGHWAGAFLAAALALAIREHGLLFVLLMAATALYYRNWHEAAAWGALVALFGAGLAWHLSVISREVLPSDPISPPWLVMRGLSGWLANVVQSSNLRWLPHWLAGPAVVLMAFGWLGWNSRTGTFGCLLSAGYGLAFMLAGRWDNFYWGMMIAPAMFAGIVFAPRALLSLVEAALPGERAALAAVK
ncbi:MAG TPA: hypothetical protein VJQ77_10570 [Novosphingobium sp.]|nr:hypothetical protein [Novosphingobium sp.]